MIHPYTKNDLARGEQVVRELHGLKGFDAWAERIAKEIAAARDAVKAKSPSDVTGGYREEPMSKLTLMNDEKDDGFGPYLCVTTKRPCNVDQDHCRCRWLSENLEHWRRLAAIKIGQLSTGKSGEGK